MDTQLLHAFIAVAEHYSFSLAAQQLHITQSAVSKRIALLEQQLSSSLFDRIGRQVRLTESGQLLLPRAKQLIDDTNSTIRLLQAQQGIVSGTLRIATSHHIGIHRLPPYLREYTARYPEVQLQVHFLDSEQATQAIHDRLFDLAVITLPKHKKDDGSDPIQQHEIWQDPMQFVVGKEHTLAATHQRFSAKVLAQYPAILPDQNTRTTALVKAVLAKKNIEPNVSMTTNHLDAIKMMVSVGLVWSVLPERLIDRSLAALTIAGLNTSILTRELGCIHHRHRTLTNAAKAMLDILKMHKEPLIKS